MLQGRHGYTQPSSNFLTNHLVFTVQILIPFIYSIHFLLQFSFLESILIEQRSSELATDRKCHPSALNSVTRPIVQTQANVRDFLKVHNSDIIR